MSFDLATGWESGVLVSGRQVGTRELSAAFGKQLRGIEGSQGSVSVLGLVCGFICHLKDYLTLLSSISVLHRYTFSEFVPYGSIKKIKGLKHFVWSGI